MVEMKIDGMKELQAKLEALGPRLARNGLRAATSAGAAIIRDQAKANVGPISQTGTLRRAIAMKRAKGTQALAAEYQIYVRQAKNGSAGQKNVKAYSKFDAYYWRFVEFGTKHVNARPFLRPAFEAKKVQAAEAIKTKLVERIEVLAKQK